MENEEVDKTISNSIETKVNEQLNAALEKFGIKDSAGFKNIIAIRDYTKETRDLFRTLQIENELYKKQIKQQNLVLEQLKGQVQQIQIRIMTLNNTTG
jgi:predicted nuclease with TOPRIM domain|tara:strand:+ start:8440 stop:8733 length:294 start_codon:yes stop_codon:yes gene_type:complete